MADIYPDEFVVRYQVKNSNYIYTLKFEDNNLFLTQFSKNNLDLQELITPIPDEWDNFWHRMDEIELWGWYEEYNMDCSDFCLDEEEWEVSIRWNNKIVESHGCNSYPSTFREFMKAVEELTGFVIEFIQKD